MESHAVSFQLIILPMDRTLESTLLHIVRTRLLQDYPGQIAACLDTLTDEQLWWRPNERANAVGNLLVHLAGSNRYYFEQAIGGRDIGRDREAEFTARGALSKAETRAVWDDALRRVADVLNALEPSQLMQTTDRTGKTTTFAQILLHVSHHNAIHTGQILWVTKMLQPGAIEDIGMKMRGR
jgi:uncharacterized damage-inducible protein DinB